MTTAVDDAKGRLAPRVTKMIGAAVLILMPALAAANTITGGTAILDAGNGSVVVSGGAPAGCINWYNGGTPPSTCPTSGGGNFTVQAGSTAPFQALVGDNGNITNLTFTESYPVVDFMTVAGFQFDLTDVRFNTGPAIGDCTSGTSDMNPGVSCTPADSPFTLTNGLTDPATGTVDTVTVSMTVDLEGYTGSSGTNYNAATPYVGIFTTQQAITNANIDSILATIRSGSSVNASWSATLEPLAQVPEPTTFLLFGAGLLIMGSGLKGRRG